MVSPAHIEVRNAHTHNLQGLTLDLPRGQLVVLTGVSGSGKSSLAFDTLYAEGQRRYLETLGNARGLFRALRRPDVDAIRGLPPTVAVSQHAVTARPRATLATVTELHDHLRLLWARRGIPFCPACDLPVVQNSVNEILRATLAFEPGTKIYVLAPLARGQPGHHRETFQQIRKSGFLRARIDGVLHEIRDDPKLKAAEPHDLDLVVDRLVIRPNLDDRLREAIGSAAKLGEGRVVIAECETGDWRDAAYTTRPACARCGRQVPELEPRLFHFNTAHGACPRCTGFGIVPVDAAQPGLEDAEDDDTPWLGAGYAACPQCQGTRLRAEARHVRFEGRGLHEVTALTVAQARDLFDAMPDHGDRVRQVIFGEVRPRLRFLAEVGLGYLTLDRPAPTLSGGEAQRARLATHLGGGLRGVCYILDEPTQGLHPRDTGRLIAALQALKARDNTVLVVEHDDAVIRQADYVVDLGPGAGRHGGQILAQGPPARVLRDPASVTARAFGEVLAPRADWREPQAWLRIVGARARTLQNLEAAFPVGRQTCLTGVSGSGKSTLAREILCHAARRHFGLAAPPPGAHDRIQGLEHFDQVVEVDQKPLGRSSRSSAATYTGVLDEIRKVFSATRLAKVRGYKVNRFSFNTRGGRCEECQGQGSLRPAQQFLPELSVPCPVCRGRRFNGPTLDVLFRGKSIADVLDLPVEEAAEFFANLAPVHRLLVPLVEVGLGYLALGQPSSTLSGGEAQRVKLAAELARKATGRTLYLFDEPTSGLHRADALRLQQVFRKLADAGNTLVIIEHHLDIIASSDWVIDLGPEGGAAGGRLVATGTPAQIAACPQSLTGQALAVHAPR